MTGLYLAVFLILAVTFIARIPSGIKSRYARLSWLACGVGTVAIFTLGPIVPVSVIDGFLGGTNVIYLVQCWLALLAFSLITEAARFAGGRENQAPRRNWLTLIYGLLIVVPFLFIDDRAGTDQLFIHNRADQFAAVACASIYMVGIAFMAIRLLVHVSGKRAAGYWLFRVGSIMVVIAIVVEISGLLSARLQLPASLTAALWTVFDPFFYTGVILIVGGVVWFWSARHLRSQRAARRIRELQSILTQRGLALPTSDDDKAYAVYALLIRITDSVALDRIHTSEEEDATIDEAERWIERILPQLLRVGA